MSAVATGRRGGNSGGRSSSLNVGIPGLTPEELRAIPSFIVKLYAMICDTENTSLINWTQDGQTFVVLNSTLFAQEILPKHFKHGNFASFIRQLNMYGFHKLGDPNWWEFTHPFFKRRDVHSLKMVKRKSDSGLSMKDELELLKKQKHRCFEQIVTLRDKQHELETQLGLFHSQNEILWNEVSESKKRHDAMQEVIQRMLFFLIATQQQNSRGLLNGPDQTKEIQNILEGFFQSRNPLLTDNESQSIITNMADNVSRMANSTGDLDSLFHSENLGNVMGDEQNAGAIGSGMTGEQGRQGSYHDAAPVQYLEDGNQGSQFTQNVYEEVPRGNYTATEPLVSFPSEEEKVNPIESNEKNADSSDGLKLYDFIFDGNQG